MIPYTAHQVTAEDKAAVMAVLESDRLTQGPTVEKLEAKLCKVSGAKYAVAVSSGTAALHLAYLACDIRMAGEITVPPVSFVATANAALLCETQVRFPDIRYFYGDPIEDAINASMEIVPGYVVTVSLGGDPWLGGISDSHTKISDHSHGPIMVNGKATTFSFHPAKHCAAGEGGAVVMDDSRIAAHCRELRNHGRGFARSEQFYLGFNYRLDEMSAALALSQLERYNWNVRRRREIAAIYDEAFQGKVRTVPHGPDSARHLYQLLVDNRDDVRQSLAIRGVGTQAHYHPIIPLQPYYRQRFGYTKEMAAERWPNAVWHSEHTLSIPMFPTLTEQEIETVIGAVVEVCA